MTAGSLRGFDTLRDTRPHRVRFPGLPWLLGFFVAFGLPVVGAASVTSADVAEPAIARLVDALTGTDALLQAEGPRLREAAKDTGPGDLVPVPGFPIEGAGIPRDELLNGSPDEWRRALLDRAAAQIYDQGLQAFAERPEASRFESGGGAWALSLLDGRVHGWLVALQAVPIFASVALAVGVLVMYPAVRRWRVLGFTLAAGAVPPLLLAILALVAASVAGGKPGTFADEAARTIAVLTRGPLVHASTVALGGVVLWWWAGRPVREDADAAARLATARAKRDARHHEAAAPPVTPRRPPDRFVDSDRTPD